MIYPDGSKYEGDWKHDVKQGFGAYYYPNGDIYEGAWFKNKRHGLGTYFYAETKTKFMGTWVEGVIQGPGQIMYPRSRFHGSWTKGVPKGPGCFVFDSNCMQHGFYLLLKDPALEGSVGEEEEREDRDYQAMAGEGDDEEDETLGTTYHFQILFLLHIFNEICLALCEDKRRTLGRQRLTNLALRW